MKNCNSIKQTCGSKNFASCIKFETAVPIFSEYYNDDCVDLEQATTELYSLIGELKTNTDVEGLLNDCITFTTPKTPSSVIEQMYLKLCELEERITAQDILIAEQEEQIIALQQI